MSFVNCESLLLMDHIHIVKYPSADQQPNTQNSASVFEFIVAENYIS